MSRRRHGSQATTKGILLIGGSLVLILLLFDILITR